MLVKTGLGRSRGCGDHKGFRHGHQRLRSIALDFMQRQRPLSAGVAAIEPALQRYIKLCGDLLIAQALGDVFAGLDPQLPQPVADAQRETRVTQVV